MEHTYVELLPKTAIASKPNAFLLEEDKVRIRLGLRNSGSLNYCTCLLNEQPLSIESEKDQPAGICLYACHEKL